MSISNILAKTKANVEILLDFLHEVCYTKKYYEEDPQ